MNDKKTFYSKSPVLSLLQLLNVPKNEKKKEIKGRVRGFSFQELQNLREQSYRPQTTALSKGAYQNADVVLMRKAQEFNPKPLQNLLKSTSKIWLNDKLSIPSLQREVEKNQKRRIIRCSSIHEKLNL